MCLTFFSNKKPHSLPSTPELETLPTKVTVNLPNKCVCLTLRKEDYSSSPHSLVTYALFLEIEKRLQQY